MLDYITLGCVAGGVVYGLIALASGPNHQKVATGLEAVVRSAVERIDRANNNVSFISTPEQHLLTVSEEVRSAVERAKKRGVQITEAVLPEYPDTEIACDRSYAAYNLKCHPAAIHWYNSEPELAEPVHKRAVQLAGINS